MSQYWWISILGLESFLSNLQHQIIKMISNKISIKPNTIASKSRYLWHSRDNLSHEDISLDWSTVENSFDGKFSTCSPNRSSMNSPFESLRWFSLVEALLNVDFWSNSWSIPNLIMEKFRTSKLLLLETFISIEKVSILFN